MEIALRAGEMIKADFHRSEGPRGSGEKAPVDTEVEVYIRQELSRLTPDWSIQGEELPFHKGTDPNHCWVLDPQDGTSAFLRGFRGSSVSIGLLQKHQPVLGVVHAPLYPNDQGDTIHGAVGVGLFRNGAPVEPVPSDHSLASQDVVAVSQDADQRIDYNLGTLKPARYLALPSVAYRLALAAAGEVRAGMSLAPVRALDVAAGDALLRLSNRVLHHLSTPDNPLIDYRNKQGLHGVIGGEPGAVKSLTPWRWNSYFGPRQDSPFARPSHRRKVKGGSLSRAQGCLLGLFAGEREEWLPALALARELVAGKRYREDELSPPCSAVLAIAREPQSIELPDSRLTLQARTISEAVGGALTEQSLGASPDWANRALRGALGGYGSIPADQRMRILTRRLRSEPVETWPVDALILAEQLLCLRKNL